MPDLKNAKRVAWVGRTATVGGSRPSIIEAAREARGQGFIRVDDTGPQPGTYNEEWLARNNGASYIHTLTVLEEFPAPTLAELVGDHGMFEIQSVTADVYVALRTLDEDGAEDWAFVLRADAGGTQVAGHWQYLKDAQFALNLDPATLVLWRTVKEHA